MAVDERKLRESVIRLAHANPDLQEQLLPLLKESADDSLPVTIDEAISTLRLAKNQRGKMKINLISSAMATLVEVVREDMASDQTVTNYGSRQLRVLMQLLR